MQAAGTTRRPRLGQRACSKSVRCPRRRVHRHRAQLERPRTTDARSKSGLQQDRPADGTACELVPARLPPKPKSLRRRLRPHPRRREPGPHFGVPLRGKRSTRSSLAARARLFNIASGCRDKSGAAAKPSCPPSASRTLARDRSGDVPSTLIFQDDRSPRGSAPIRDVRPSPGRATPTLPHLCEQRAMPGHGLQRTRRSTPNDDKGPASSRALVSALVAMRRRRSLAPASPGPPRRKLYLFPCQIRVTILSQGQ